MNYQEFGSFVDELKTGDTYWSESAKLEFAVEINDVMRRNGTTNKRLSEIISKSPAYVSKVLRGDTNFTIETMVKLARAVGCKLSVHIAPCDSKTRWIDVIKNFSRPPVTLRKVTWKTPESPIFEGESDAKQSVAA